MVNDSRNPRAYELMSIIVPDLSEEDTAAALERLSGYITAVGGEIRETLTDSPWGRRRLAYTIRFQGVDYRDGVYAVTHFTAAPSALGDLERDLKLDTAVMRHLLVMDDPKAGEQMPEPVASEEAQPATSTAAVAQAEGAEAAPAAAEAPAAEQAPAAETPAVEAPAEPERAAAPANSKLPTEGEGTDWVAGDGTNAVHEGFPIKGNASSKIYHPEASPSYNNTVAELYFASPEAAERAGYRLPKTMQQAGASAAATAKSLAEQAAEAAQAMTDEENPAPADAASGKEG